MEYSFSEQTPQDSNPDSSLHTQLQNYISSGQWQRAKDVASSLLSSQPESAWLHNHMGHILHELNELKLSETHYKKSIALQPDFADSYRGLAHVYLSLGRTGTAEDNIRKALSIDPHDDHAWIIFGHLALYFDDPQNAIQHANHALEINPSNTAAQDIIIRAQGELTGDQKLSSQERIKQFKDLLTQEPENDLYHHRIGEIYLEETKDYKSAETHFRKALSIDPNDDANQAGLIQSLRKRDLFLRFLWLPYLPIKLILKFFNFFAEITSGDIKLKDILIILACLPALILTKPLIMILIISFLLFGTIFWPLTKAYEYLTIADIHKKMGKITLYKGPFAKIHQLSFLLRFSIFTLFVIVFWSTIALLLSHEEIRNQVIVYSILITVILCIILVLIGLFSPSDKKSSDPSNRPFHKP